MNPLYETSSGLGLNKITVYPDKIVYSTGISYMKKEETILLSQVASVKTNILNQVVVETSGGKEYKLIVKSNEKENLKNTILNAMQK